MRGTLRNFGLKVGMERTLSKRHPRYSIYDYTP